MKKCTKCNEIKSLNNFNKAETTKDRLTGHCKICLAISNKEWREKNKKKMQDYRQKYYAENKHYIDGRQKEYRSENLEVLKEKQRASYKLNPEEAKNRVKEYRFKKFGKQKAEKKRIREEKERSAMIRRCEREYHKRYLHPVKTNLRVRLNIALKLSGNIKDKSALSVIGCDINTLTSHIEKQFIKGMSWENNTINGWHIDHIIPLSSADTKEGIEFLFHYTNLQPLWAEENRLKRHKIPLVTNLYFKSVGYYSQKH